ncbi:MULTISPECIES: hypothetical protein [Rhizobium]|uniref:Uncharacterized protein n=1 Tax=Rhizobium aouanii TaxID=3118145 RepID=A0ABU8CV74_9HYPH|nr:hypothetical protein [Rhizobium acaciae]MCW1754154.1 hypothetical protein [Rhizobium acaciae]
METVAIPTTRPAAITAIDLLTTGGNLSHLSQKERLPAQAAFPISESMKVSISSGVDDRGDTDQ